MAHRGEIIHFVVSDMWDGICAGARIVRDVLGGSGEYSGGAFMGCSAPL